ncbi:hypothetical protein LP52_09160 [Streptomonospora alba]|uniref:Methyltransferase n=1 Tax=Streptomonospora alba TaxID=183763 RepID=A0A0C2JCI4_9ACTN|nr:class I SAM-dependent methyltransferase [Streptomonospora alba]KIH99131.1 hypothetical protein LP52_09160 [Streptomonospora alba]
MTAAQGRRMSAAAADDAVEAITDRLSGAGLLPPGASFDRDAFHALRGRVRRSFHVPQTSITPIMARLLFAVGDAYAPHRLLVIGSYYGNTLVWLAGRALLDGRGGEYVGADIDAAACAGARRNFAALDGRVGVRIEERDGREVLETAADWDLLLLDADDPATRKAVYLPLLQAALPRTVPGALVLAHDTAMPLFAEQLLGYKEAVADRDVFRACAHLPVDECGLDVSVVGAPSRNRTEEPI